MRTGTWTALAGVAFFLPIALAAQPARGPDPASRDFGVQATGRILCDGVPLRNVPVELWDGDETVLTDDKMASSHTLGDGTFALFGIAGDPDGSRPDVYLRVVYGDAVEGFAPDGTRFTSRVDVEDDVGRTRFDKTDEVEDAASPVDFKDIELRPRSGDCNVFRNARDVVLDWHQLMRRPFPAPGAEARVLRKEKLGGTPFAWYNVVQLPTDYMWRSDLRQTLFHEFGHVIWFSIHSPRAHWDTDITTYVYARDHSGPAYHARDAWAACNTQYCAQGFAWSEGFADFWRERWRYPAPIPLPTSYVAPATPADPTQEWEYEDNVRQRLLFLASCLSKGSGYGYAPLVFAGWRPPPLYSIHSLPDFEAYALDDHPELRACTGSNAPVFCGRLCPNGAGDCGGTCPRCVPIPTGDTFVSTCVGDRGCGQLCRSNFDCTATACSTCIPVWYGDVAVSECH